MVGVLGLALGQDAAGAERVRAVQVPEASITARARSRRIAPLPFETASTNGFVSRPLLITLSAPCRVIAVTLAPVSIAGHLGGVSDSGLR